MNYIIYKRFKGKGIDGSFNLKYGTICPEREGFIYSPDGRRICATTSENGWEHFHPDSEQGKYRTKLLSDLYKYYGSPPGKEKAPEDFDPTKWPEAVNYYWKNLLRTMPTDKLIEYHKERLGERRNKRNIRI